MLIIEYILLSVFAISLLSLIGVFTLGMRTERLKSILIYLISFSAGALFGDVFIHILPEVSKSGFSILSAFMFLLGILIFFILEKIIHWKHCHMPITKEHKHPFTYTILLGDTLHNFIDGLIIAASYLASVPIGIATTLAVFLHEIPQEIGDYAVLVHGGFSRKKALFVNFLSALTAVLGALVAYFLGNAELSSILLPIAAGGFIYVAGSDLIPEMHKETELRKSILQVISFILGILIMALLLFLG